jgi:mannose-6-phosphate isomerase-like protein (cupin superfamily)
MKIHHIHAAIDEVRKKAATQPRGCANMEFGLLNDYSIGLGCYSGQSPWERHPNGDEMLYVLDGEVKITVLSGREEQHETLRSGCLFVVPKDRWHQLDTSDGVSIFYASPPEEGAVRTRHDPRLKSN